jgi:PAS domain S-box-containing protein
VNADDSANRLRILMVEDNPVDAELNERELRKGGLSFTARRVDNKEDFERELLRFKPQIILSDYELPSFDGVSAMLVAQSHSPDTPFIFITGVMGEEMAIDFLKRGATDYVLKDRLSRLVPAVRRALEEVEERAGRRQAQAAMRESEEKYRTIFESTGTAMFTMDEHGTVTFVNKEFERMTGWGPDDAEGRIGMTDVLVEDDVEVESFKRYHSDVLGGGRSEPLHFETRVRNKIGVTRNVLASMALLPGTRWAVVSLIDVTREKLYEDQLRERAERLREFLTVASHELRQPITILSGYTATLSRYRGQLPEDSVGEIFSSMDAAADRLTRIVDELMDVSRIEKQEVVLQKVRADLEQLVKRSIRAMRSRGAGNEFNVTVSPEVTQVEVDPEKFVQLLTILVENAVNFSPATSPIDISARSEGSSLVVSVSDRGPGVPEGDREKVFERFYQVDDVLHHSKPGVGLGLYIAREIVAGHGGSIECLPRDGGGAVFLFTIPHGTPRA